MTHADLNPVDPKRPKRAAIVISNPAVSTSTGWPVGFWWSELTHPYYAFSEVGWQVDIYSPDGGRCTWDAMSDPEDASQWQAEDVISRGYKHDPAFLALVEDTRPVRDLDVVAAEPLPRRYSAFLRCRPMRHPPTYRSMSRNLQPTITGGFPPGGPIVSPSDRTPIGSSTATNPYGRPGNARPGSSPTTAI